MKNLIEETFSAIRDDYSEALVSLDMGTFESEYGGKAFASIENSAHQDDSFIPPILRGWPVVENLTHEAWIDFNKTDEHDFPNVGINFEFRSLTNSLEMKISPYFTHTNDGEQVFIEDKMAQFSFAKDIQPQELAANISEILTKGQKLESLATKDELGKLNEQLNAIRKDPLLILDASDGVKQAAADVQIYYDWVKDPAAWKIIADKVDENEKAYLAANPEAAQRYGDFHCSETSLQRAADLEGDMCSDPSKLLEAHAAPFDFILDSIYGEAQDHEPVKVADNGKLIPLFPPPAQDVFFAVPIADTKLAQDSGLEVVQVGVWKLPASMQQNLDGSEKGQQDPRNLFSQIDFTKKPKSVSKDTGIEM